MQEFLKNEIEYLKRYFKKHYNMIYTTNELMRLGIHWMYRDVIDKIASRTEKEMKGKIEK